jgi:uncharacterized membrane protein (DUF485 family)
LAQPDEGPVDWDALADDPEFLALQRARRRFVIPATVFFLVFYLALPVSVAVAPHLMGRPVLGSLSLAFAFGLAQFVVAWLLATLYIVAAKSFDTTATHIVERARSKVRT